MLKIIKVILTFCIILPLTMTTVYANSNYIYETFGPAIAAPVAYETRTSIRAQDLGVSSLSNLNSVFVKDNKVYIADADKIIITDYKFKVIKIISEFEINGQTQIIKNPSGLFVTDIGDIYVAEPDNARILIFDSDYKLKSEYLKPNAIGLEEVLYKPTKLVVDKLGRIFVIARNVYEGIMELSPEGEFSRFYGVNNVAVNPIDLFWRSIATKAQREQMQLWLPTDFSNLAINKDGFIFSTSRGNNQEDTLKMLNSKGEDILRFNMDRPIGDYMFPTSGYNTKTGPSELIAIDCNDYGMYAVLDAKRMRIFVYNEDGYLLYLFGGSGGVDGTFRTPVDIKFMEDDILILDQMAQTIEVMKPTVYAQAINNAVKLQYKGDFVDASQEWAKVAKLNPNLELAYVGMGKAELRSQNYQYATQLFRKGSDQTYYSKAFDKYRAEFIDKNFGYFFGIIIVLIVLGVGVKIYKRLKYGKIYKPERSDSE